jgi:hypothetical protein
MILMIVKLMAMMMMTMMFPYIDYNIKVINYPPCAPANRKILIIKNNLNNRL